MDIRRRGRRAVLFYVLFMDEALLPSLGCRIWAAAWGGPGVLGQGAPVALGVAVWWALGGKPCPVRMPQIDLKMGRTDAFVERA
jgi:hypothetical protein